MIDSKTAVIEAILTDVQEVLRQRLKVLGVEIGYVILAVSPDGTGVLRSNVGEDELGDLADLLAAMAECAELQRPDNQLLH